MKIESKDGNIHLSDVYNPVIITSNDGEEIAVCQRDTGFEFTYEGEDYEAKQGKVNKLHKAQKSFESNLNYPVRIKLTKKGKEFMLGKHLHISKDGFCEIQIHRFMSLFKDINSIDLPGYLEMNVTFLDMP